jgi:hypothetical protein
MNSEDFQSENQVGVNLNRIRKTLAELMKEVAHES